ncbi:hypothetical protein PIB30_070180 [Stylosanthes scabra]|uniref:Uncharacterized protein n=1 Tax=Stylosanthes scabra TaxID=79078 RepID=A0ABU6YMB2_9FABA|nr:hypothetical protein [Stylosanthes scabra]
MIPQAGNLRFSPPSSYTTHDLFSHLSFFMMRPIASFSPRPAASPRSSTSSGSVGSVHRERSRSPCTLLPPMAPAPGPVYPVPRTRMCDARRYRSLFPRRRVAPPTPPPPSPPPSDEEPSAETYDPVTKLVGDPDEPYVAELVPYRAPEAYYSDASYGSERESASTNSAPFSHHSSGSSSGSVFLGYGSASGGSASDGASDDDLMIIARGWKLRRLIGVTYDNETLIATLLHKGAISRVATNRYVATHKEEVARIVQLVVGMEISVRVMLLTLFIVRKDKCVSNAASPMGINHIGLDWETTITTENYDI